MRMQQARRRLPTLPQDRRVAAPVSAELRAWRVALVALGALFAGLSLARAAVMDSPARAYSIDGAKDIPLSAYVVGGDAVKRDKELRLTSDQQSQVGYVFTRDPLSSIGDEWRIDVSFRISGRGVTLFGDGMAFWYTRESFTPPAEGASASGVPRGRCLVTNLHCFVSRRCAARVWACAVVHGAGTLL